MNIKYLFILLLVLTAKAGAQTILKGEISSPYDYSVALEKVEIKSSSGNTSSASRTGQYHIQVKLGDTIRYYCRQRLIDAYIYNNSSTNPIYNVTINLDEIGNAAHELATVKVYGRNYVADSVRRRELYADLYNYKDPRLSMGDNRLVKEISFMGETQKINNFDKKLSLLDLQSFIHIFSFRKRRKRRRGQLLALQAEQSAYIRHRFTKNLIEKYGNIYNEDSLNTFIQQYAPTYEALKKMSDFEMCQYIATKSRLYRNGVSNH